MKSFYVSSNQNQVVLTILKKLKEKAIRCTIVTCVANRWLHAQLVQLSKALFRLNIVQILYFLQNLNKLPAPSPHTNFQATAAFGFFGLSVLRCKKNHETLPNDLLGKTAVFERRRLNRNNTKIRRFQQIVLDWSVFDCGKKSYMLQFLIFATYQTSKRLSILKIRFQRQEFSRNWRSAKGNFVGWSRKFIAMGTFWAIHPVIFPMH